MKLLVAGVMVVLLASFVFANDVVWQTAKPFSLTPKVHIQEDVPLPVLSVASQTHEEAKAQDSQDNAGNPMPLSKPSSPDPRKDQSDTLYDQSVEQLKIAREANEIAARDNRIQERLVRVGWITIGTMVLLTLAQLYFVWTANQHAAAAVLAAKESVEVANRGLQVGNRAYLFVKEWKILDLRNGVQPIIRCTIYNAGNTPAILEKRLLCFDMLRSVPPPLTPSCLSDSEGEEIPVNVHEETVGIYRSSFITMDEQTLREESLFLYVAVCFVYRDVFRQRYWVVRTDRYNMGDDTFTLVDGLGYNGEYVYREEEWADKNNQR